MKRVFILGAGFSKPRRAPLVRELNNLILQSDFPLHKRWVNSPQITEDTLKEREEAIGWLKEIVQMHNARGKSYEEILSHYENLLSSKTTYSLKKGDDIRNIRHLLIWGAAHIFEERFTNVNPLPHTELYERFCSKVINPQQDSVISFNWDLILEDAIMRLRNRDDIPWGFKYGIDYSKEGTEIEEYFDQDGLLISKIHGSFNWVICDNSPQKCPTKGLPKIKGEKWVEPTPLTYYSPFHWGCSICDGQGKLSFLIVPPIEEKELTNELLNPVWGNALRSLQEADHIYTIGYSFPEYDVAFAELLHIAFGTLKNRNPPMLTCISPSSDPYERVKDFPVSQYNFIGSKFEDLDFDIFKEEG